MEERLSKLLNLLNRHADRVMVGLLLIALCAVVAVKFTENSNLNYNPISKVYELKQFIPNPEYTRTIEYLNANPRISQVSGGKYQDIQIHNPFDKQIIQRGEEIERRLNQLMRDARESFQGKRYEECIRICNQILSQDFGRDEAKDLRRKSQEALGQGQ